METLRVFVEKNHDGASRAQVARFAMENGYNAVRFLGETGVFDLRGVNASTAFGNVNGMLGCPQGAVMLDAAPAQQQEQDAGHAFA